MSRGFVVTFVIYPNILPSLRFFDGDNKVGRQRNHVRRDTELVRRKRSPSLAIDNVRSGNICKEEMRFDLNTGMRLSQGRRDQRELQHVAENLVPLAVYEPAGAPASDVMAHSRKVPAMTAGRAALVELIHRYLAGLLDPYVTLLEVHKLMYFMQESGEPLRLRFTQAPYGPYAENLRHVLHAIEGHLIAGYADGGDAPDKQLSLVPGAVEDAAVFLSQHADTRARFDKVAALVEGFESPFGLELLSTVHWVMKHESVATLDAVVERTYAWNERKRQFSRRQVGIAMDVLSEQGWTV
jgi:hypothetical protein